MTDNWYPGSPVRLFVTKNTVLVAIVFFKVSECFSKVFLVLGSGSGSKS